MKKRKRLNLWVVGVVLILAGALLYVHNYQRDAAYPEGTVITYPIDGTSPVFTLPEVGGVILTESQYRDFLKMRKDVSRLKLWAWGERDE